MGFPGFVPQVVFWLCPRAALHSGLHVMDHRQKLLFVTQQIPWPLDSGGNIRTFHLLRALSEALDVTLLSSRNSTGNSGQDADDWREALSFCGELCILENSKSAGAAGKAWSVARSILRSRPAVVEHNYSAAMAAAVRSARERGRAPFMHLNHLDTTPYRLAGVPFAVDSHNVLHQFYERQAEQYKGATRTLVGLEARRVKRYELAQFRTASSVFVCSEPEREHLRSLDPSLDPLVVPNGVDCASFQFRKTLPTGSELVFLGDMAYPPNHAAALEFIDVILPLIRRELPAATFRIIGKNPAADLRDRASETAGVEVTGFVDDVRAEVQRGRVFVVPLRNGSGTRLKILEAMALGVPVVATHVGAEGIEAREAKELRLEDDPAEFASAVVELVRDDGACERLARAGRSLVEDRYDWNAIGRELATHYTERLLPGVGLSAPE